MAVDYYQLKSCWYQLGKLKGHIFLLPKDTTRIDYSIENFQCQVNGVQASEIIKIEGLSASMNVTESINGRLGFDSTVTLNLGERNQSHFVPLVKRIMEGEWFVVVEDEMGVKFIQSTEFSSEFAYNMNYTSQDESEHYSELIFTCSSNHPMNMLNSDIKPTEILGNDCSMLIGNVEKLWLTPYNYSLIECDRVEQTFSKVICTNGESWYDVEFLPKTFSFTEQYKGGQYTHTLRFTIPLNDYKFYFRFNLVQFELNKYAMMFKTSNGNYLTTGFEFGLMPTYTIETSDDETELNTITITLSNTTNDSVYYSTEEPEMIDSDSGIYIPCTEPLLDSVSGEYLPYYVCINKTTAIYTVLQMVTLSGQPVGKYKVLKNYEEVYKHLNVIGTFDEDEDLGINLKFPNSDCSLKENCKFTRLSDTIFTFHEKGETKTMRLRSECPWTLDGIPDWINASITSGDPLITYELTFTCLKDAEADVLKHTGHFHSLENEANVTWILEALPDWIEPYEFHITAKQQTLFTKVHADYVDYYVCEYDDAIVAEKVPGIGGVRMIIPENNSEEETFVFKVKLCNTLNGKEAWITIYQDKLYTEWRKDGDDTICVGKSSYERLVKWKGYYPDQINIMTNEYRAGALLTEYDSECIGGGPNYQEDWRFVTGELCVGKDLYGRQRKYISRDGGETWEATDEYRPRGIIEENAYRCQIEGDYQYEWRLDATRRQCVGFDSYYIEVKYQSSDGYNWVQCYPEETRVSDVVYEANSKECEASQTDPNYAERWQRTDRTICVDGVRYELERKEISNDGGQTWTETDEYRQGQSTHSPCTEDRKRNDLWVTNYQKYICVGTTSWYVEQLGYYYDDDPDTIIMYYPYIEQKSLEMKQENSLDCGWEPEGGDKPNPIPDRDGEWNECDHTACLNGTLWQLEEWFYYDGQWKASGIHNRVKSLGGCSSGPIEYGWLIDHSKYICEGGTSYYVMYRCQRTDGGEWVKVTPEEWRKSSSVYRVNDPLCGWSDEPIYRWNYNTNKYECQDGNLYTRVDKEKSHDNGLTWEYADEWKLGNLVDIDSEQCIEEPEYQYRWVVDRTRFVCNGYDSYYMAVKQRSVDGIDWENVVPEETRMSSTLKMEKDPECDKRIYQYVWDGYYICATEDGEINPDKPYVGPDEPEDNVEWKVVEGDWICDEKSVTPTPPTPPTPEEDKDLEYAGENIVNHPYYNEYFTVEAINDGSVKMYSNIEGSDVNVMYSLNGGDWKEIGTSTVSMVSGDKLRFKNVSKGTYYGYYRSSGITSDRMRSIFNSLPNCKIYGNINSMYQGDDFTTKSVTYNSMFNDWFKDVNVIDATNLVIPYQNLESAVCANMFEKCKTLVYPPSILPSLVLSESCYLSMFSGCTSLEEAPVLPAKSLVYQCYMNMFSGCSSIRYIKCLAESFERYSTLYWTEYTPSEGTFVKKKGIDWSRGEDGIPDGWTVEEVD